MKASLFTLAFESRLTIVCAVIGSPLPEYFPFWRGDNPPIFSCLRSDSPLFFILLIYMSKWWCFGPFSASAEAEFGLMPWLPGSWNFLRSHLNVGQICALAITINKFFPANKALICALSCLLYNHLYAAHNIDGSSSNRVAIATRLATETVCQLSTPIRFHNAGTPKKQFHERSLVMPYSKGTLHFQPLFTSEELGLPYQANIAHVVKTFLTVAEGIALRQIEMPNCVVLLQSVPGDSQSGAIYFFDRETQIFYLAVFDQGADDSLSAAEFEQLVNEYDLLAYAENPKRLLTPQTVGNA
jgi:hypothetical protein